MRQVVFFILFENLRWNTVVFWSLGTWKTIYGFRGVYLSGFVVWFRYVMVYWFELIHRFVNTVKIRVMVYPSFKLFVFNLLWAHQFYFIFYFIGKIIVTFGPSTLMLSWIALAFPISASFCIAEHRLNLYSLAHLHWIQLHLSFCVLSMAILTLRMVFLHVSVGLFVSLYKYMENCCVLFDPICIWVFLSAKLRNCCFIELTFFHDVSSFILSVPFILCT